MEAYDSLSTFPDVENALRSLSKMQGFTSVVFSNGTHTMVSNSVTKSPDLSPHASLFKEIVVVDDAAPTVQSPSGEYVKRFKPTPEVYYHLADRLGKGKSREEMRSMWLISGNPFDIVASQMVGMKAAWVDRQGSGWQDQLLNEPEGKPTVVGHDLSEIIDQIVAYVGK
jgi:2-haloacid dehalogenase